MSDKPQRVLKISQPSTMASRASNPPRVKTVLAGPPIPEKGWNCKFSRLVHDGEIIDSRPFDPEENPS
jgi:hypothetical protein